LPVIALRQCDKIGPNFASWAKLLKVKIAQSFKRIFFQNISQNSSYYLLHYFFNEKCAHLFKEFLWQKMLGDFFGPKYRVTLLFVKLTGLNVFSIETLFSRPSSLFRRSGNVHMYVHTYTYVGNMYKIATKAQPKELAHYVSMLVLC
jgi:hypothetical protein